MDTPNHATGELANESMRSPITMRNHVASERASEPVDPPQNGRTVEYLSKPPYPTQNARSPLLATPAYPKLA